MSRSSLSNGTPPLIDRRYCDVQLPGQQDMLLPHDREEGSRAATCFLALCRLTRLLARILPVIYCVDKIDGRSSSQQLTEIEIGVSQWHDELPTWATRDYGSRPAGVEGLLNLQLAHLAVKLTIARLNLRLSSTSISTESREHNLQECQSVASSIADFISNLTPSNIGCFWMPYTAANCTMTATVLLRCYFEQRGSQASSVCLDACRKMLGKLRVLRREASWDLADSCLEQYADVVDVMEAESSTAKDMSHDSNIEVPIGDMLEGSQWGLDDVFNIDLFGDAQLMLGASLDS